MTPENRQIYINNLATRIKRTEERLCSPGLEDEEINPIALTLENLNSIDGCHLIIEMLLDNIEVME